MIEHRIIVEGSKLIFEAKGSQNYKWVPIKEVEMEEEKEAVAILVQLERLNSKGFDGLIYKTQDKKGFGVIDVKELDQIMAEKAKEFNAKFVKALLMSYVGIQ